MKYQVKTNTRTVADLSNPDWGNDISDPDGILKLSDSKKAVFKNNPFLRSMSQPAQFAGTVDGHAMGRINPFTYQIVADGVVYEVVAGDSHYVEKKYRRTMYALELGQMEIEASKDKIALDCGLSSDAQKLARLSGVPVFPLQRFAIVRRSFNLLSKYGNGIKIRVLSKVADVFFFIHSILLGLLVKCKTACWKYEKIELADVRSIAEYCEEVAKDTHRFRVNETAEWVRWVLGFDFFGETAPMKELYRCSAKGRTIGYVIARSGEKGRGRRGKILDWQSASCSASEEAWMILGIAMRISKRCDSVIISIPDENQCGICLFKKILPRLSPQVAVFACKEESSLFCKMGWNEAKNWRVRPSMGDACFY